MGDREPLLFSIGPTEMEDRIRQIGACKLPYFRTNEFSDINIQICDGIKKIVGTKKESEVVLLTASGTAAMEAAVINTFNEQDYVLVIVGGTFGERFAQICEIHKIKYKILRLNQGQKLTKQDLEPYKGQGFTGVLVNGHETSTCVYYDLKMIGEFCREENCIYVVDGISTVLADPYYMDQWNIDITILSSQKGLALPPGLSIVVVNERTVNKIKQNEVRSLYFRFTDYFDNMKRGQTPYTPAVGILLQLKQRIDDILEVGVDQIILKTKLLAEDFRQKIKSLPFTIPSQSLSNAATPLQPREGISAYQIFLWLAKHHNIYVCPNGGILKDRLFRVGHIGNLTTEDNDRLISALEELKLKGGI